MEKLKKSSQRQSTTEFIMVMPFEEVKRRLESQGSFHIEPVYTADGKVTYEISPFSFPRLSPYVRSFYLLSLSRWNTTETKVILLNAPQVRWTTITRIGVGLYGLLIAYSLIMAFFDLQAIIFTLALLGMGFFVYTNQDSGRRHDPKKAEMLALKQRRNTETTLDTIIDTLTSMAATDYIRST